MQRRGGCSASSPALSSCRCKAGPSGAPVALLQGAAVLGDDDVVQFLNRGVLGWLVERDLALLKQVDPVGDLQHLGVVVRDHDRSEEHTSELQSRRDLVCRLLLEKKKKKQFQLQYKKKIKKKHK